MRATMSPYLRYAAIMRAGLLCLTACAVLGLVQFGLTPRLGLRAQVLLSVVTAALAVQGIALMVIVSLGRVRLRAVARRTRRTHRPQPQLDLQDVRNVWQQPQPVLVGD